MQFLLTWLCLYLDSHLFTFSPGSFHFPALSIPIVEYVVHDNKTPDSLSTTPSSVEPLPELTDKAAESTEPTPDLREEKTSKISKDSPRGTNGRSDVSILIFKPVKASGIVGQ